MSAETAETVDSPSSTKILPSAATIGAMTLPTWADPEPTPRFQAIWKFGAAMTCSTRFSDVPPGCVQAVTACGPGRKKSRPDRAADGDRLCSNSSTEMRWPAEAVAPASSLPPPRPNGRLRRTVPQDAIVAATPQISATFRTRFIGGVL